MSELNDGDEIGGTQDMGGFSLPPEGNIAKGSGVLMCFTGVIKVCGDDDDGLLFEVEYADDPSAKSMIYCKPGTQAGLSKIVGIGQESGVFNKIDKIRVSKQKQPIQSANGTVKVKTLTDPKFMNQMKKELVGCSVYCTIKHSEAKPYQDKVTGETKEGFAQANISKMVSVENYKALRFGTIAGDASHEAVPCSADPANTKVLEDGDFD